MSKTIFVLHERSTKEHFIALESYAEEHNLTVKYREFLIARYGVRSIVRFDFPLFIQQIRNVFFLLGLLFSRNKKIVFGIAPLNAHLPLLRRFLKKHHAFFITSWGDWSGNRFPRNHDSNSEKLRSSWRTFLEKDIKGVFSVTQSAADNMKEHYQITAPIAIVGHSIDNSISVEERKKKDKTSIQLICVGRLVETKGIRELLLVMQQLDSEKYTLKIIGDGPLKKEVEEAAATASNIEYLGYVKDKKELFDLYAESDLQLLFSKKSEENFWEELFGMVIIEAMYCGLPTVATNHVGPKSIIENGVNGFLVSETSMVDETIKILKASTFEEETMKFQAKNTAQKFYKKNLSKEWAKILDGYILQP